MPPHPDQGAGFAAFSQWLDQSLLELQERQREFWTPRSLLLDLILSVPQR